MDMEKMGGMDEKMEGMGGMGMMPGMGMGMGMHMGMMSKGMWRKFMTKEEKMAMQVGGFVMNKYLIPAHRLPEYDVVNSAGEDLGQAQEFMIDMTTGHVAYVVVAFGGTLGLSDKWLAMPFDALCWSPEKKKFTVDLKREVLVSAPGIDKSKWPDQYMKSNTGWLDDLYAHYSCKPYWEKDAVTTMPAKQEDKMGVMTKDQMIAWMEEYLKQVKLEEQGVNERLASLKGMQ